jgi:hypothetical protein
MTGRIAGRKDRKQRGRYDRKDGKKEEGTGPSLQGKNVPIICFAGRVFGGRGCCTLATDLDMEEDGIISYVTVKGEGKE